MASPITWTLTNVVFQDGTTATGSFTFDSGSLSNVDITLTGGAGAPFTTVTGFAFSGFENLDEVASFFSPNGSTYGIVLDFGASGIESSLGTAQNIGLSSSGSGFLLGGGGEIQGYKSGELDGVAQAPVTTTPEPATWALLGTGGLMLLGLGYARRRGAEI